MELAQAERLADLRIKRSKLNSGAKRQADPARRQAYETAATTVNTEIEKMLDGIIAGLAAGEG
jgi:hypothetical protein